MVDKAPLASEVRRYVHETVWAHVVAPWAGCGLRADGSVDYWTLVGPDWEGVDTDWFY